MPVVNKTSRRVGHVTLETSERTCWINWNGFVVAICVLSVNCTAHLTLLADDFKSTSFTWLSPISFYCHNDCLISTNLHPNLSKLLALINDSSSLSNCYNWAPWKITNTPETLHSLPIWEKLTPTEVSDTIYKHRQLCYTVRAISRLSDLHFPPKLTTRESEILPLLLAGITRDEIASSLSVSPETVKLHAEHSFQIWRDHGA